MSQSKIQVDSIQGNDSPYAVNFSQGISMASGTSITGAGNINLTGVCTATTLVGNGDGITGVEIITSSRSIALSYISG